VTLTDKANGKPRIRVIHEKNGIVRLEFPSMNIKDFKFKWAQHEA